jgi:secondary thiamine-phosphate synthase enzyme
MDSELFEIETGDRPAVVDITDMVSRFCADRGDGLVSIFVPHATAGLAVIETGAGSDLDLLTAIDDILPTHHGRWRHDHGSPGHGRDHVMPAFVPPSLTIPVLDGRLQLGTWQSITLVDPNADNPHRHVRLSFLTG